MERFKTYFQNIYATFGYPLTERTALSPDALDAAGERLGVKVPAALRDYYLVAGRERRFNTSLNRLLSTSDWTIDKKRLIFMEENQSVVCWGVSIRNPDSDDPPVSQGIDDDESFTWHPEHRKCSVFLAVMLHYQAVSGGCRYCGGGDAPEQSSYRFEAHGWTYHGQVTSMSAYSRPNQVVCVMPPGPLRFMQNWRVLAGGKTKRDLETIAAEVGVTLE